MKEELIVQLKNGRKHKGLTQEAVADAIGITASTLCHYERGHTQPDIDTFINLCKLYGLDFYGIIEKEYGILGFTPAEIEMIQKYRLLNMKEKAIVDSAMRMVQSKK